MNKNIHRVVKLINEKNIFFEDNYLNSRNLKKAEFDEIFPLELYPSQEFNNEQGSVSCDDIDYVFDDFHAYIEIINKSEIDKPIINHKKIILKDGTVYDVDDFAVKLKQWTLLFEKLANHKYCGAYNTYIFIEKKTYNTSTVLEEKFDNFSKLEIIKLVKDIKSPHLLLASCLIEDAHQRERISTMKTSLTSLINDKKLNLFELLCSAESLLDCYHKTYETYLRSFSFEEFIKDLEDDVGTFINKVEEQIQGFYIQALAVPGAVILASALRSVDKGISLSLIFSTILALIIVFTSLKSKVKFINRIENNTLTKLNIYKKRTEDIENTAAKSSILDKISEAIASVNATSKESKDDIYRMKDIIITLGIFYIITAVIFGRF